MTDALAKPRRRRTKPLIELRRDRLDKLTAFEHELLTAKCRYHTAAAVCDQCTQGIWCDRLGFPLAVRHPNRSRWRLCPGCRKLCTLQEWDCVFGAHASAGSTCSTCSTCSPRSTAETPSAQQ